MNFSRVTVIGAGAWGTTLAHVLSNKTESVTLWTDNQRVRDSIQATRHNALYLPETRLADHVFATSDAHIATDDCQLFFCAIPVQFMRPRLRAFSPYVVPGSVGISLAKGLESGTLARPSQIFETEWRDLATTGSLVGANIASEVATGHYTEACLALTTLTHLDHLQQLLTTDRFRVSATTDVVGIELAAALKNVIAIAAGVCDGLDLGINTKSVVITRGLQDLRCLATLLGGNADTTLASPTLGDLLATCFSPLSRNRRLGEYIGRGLSLDAAKAKLHGRIAEGVATSSACHNIALKLSLSLPVFSAVYKLLHEGASPIHCTNAILSR